MIQEGDEPAYAYASSKTALNKSISLKSFSISCKLHRNINEATDDY